MAAGTRPPHSQRPVFDPMLQGFHVGLLQHCHTLVKLELFFWRKKRSKRKPSALPNVLAVSLEALYISLRHVSQSPSFLISMSLPSFQIPGRQQKGFSASRLSHAFIQSPPLMCISSIAVANRWLFPLSSCWFSERRVMGKLPLEPFGTFNTSSFCRCLQAGPDFGTLNLGGGGCHGATGKYAHDIH